MAGLNGGGEAGVGEDGLNIANTDSPSGAPDISKTESYQRADELLNERSGLHSRELAIRRTQIRDNKSDDLSKNQSKGELFGPFRDAEASKSESDSGVFGPSPEVGVARTQDEIRILSEQSRRERIKNQRNLEKAKITERKLQEIAQAKAVGEKSGAIIGPLEEAMKEMENFRYDSLQKGFGKFVVLRQQLKDLDIDQYDTIREIFQSKEAPSETDLEYLDSIRNEEGTKAEAIKHLEQESPENFYALNLLKLRNYTRQIRKGRLVETPYVEKTIKNQLNNLDLGQTAFIYGDTGSGKTEVARIIAKRYYERFETDPEKRMNYQPIILRGYPGMTSEEMSGHTELKISNAVKASELPKRVEAEFAEYTSRNPEADEKAKADALRLITEKLLHENSATYSEFIIGAVYQAAQEGKVLIIDEANYIPEGLMAKLNDIMTKRPGETIAVQEDGVSPIVVKEGFGIIMTGNVDSGAVAERYKSRRDLDPAMRDRIVLQPHDYLPQVTQGELADYDKSEDADKKQLFIIAIASLLDPYGGLAGPKDALEKIWKLSKLARLTEDVFAGNFGENNVNGMLQGSERLTFKTKKLISPRGLMAIVQEWSRSGFQYELDHYVYKYLIQNTENIKERAYFYQMAQLQAGLFSDDAWPHPSDYGSNGVVPDMQINDPLIRLKGEKTYHPPMEVIQAIYGKPPVRKEWPSEEAAEESQEDERAAEFYQLEQEFEDKKRQIQEWAEKIGDVCPVDQEEA
jgi:MoxR-like ATPase